MATETFDRLRALALEGLSPTPLLAASRRKIRPPDDGCAPEISPSTEPVLREHLPLVLLDAAELQWRRASQPWTPSLARLHHQGVVSVVVRRGDVDVTLRNGMQRARGLPREWISVVVAALTGRELPSVRASMRRGVNVFVREDVIP